MLAVPGHEGAGLPELPPYVARAHEAEIDVHLSGAVSRMIVATGTSCTGKSRALYEALLRHEEVWTGTCGIQPDLSSCWNCSTAASCGRRPCCGSTTLTSSSCGLQASPSP